MRRRVPLLLAAAALVAVACSGDDDDDGGGGGEETTTTAPVEAAEPEDFSGRGPYAVGQVDLELDPDHVVAVFYPVDADTDPSAAAPYSYSGDTIFGPAISNLLPGALSGEISPPDTFIEAPASADGPFPVVLHSHGFSGNLRFGNLHNAQVASWGYVVAAVDHPERGVVSILESFVSGGEGGDRPDEYLDSDQLIAGLDLLAEETETDGSPLAGVVDAEQVATEGHSAGGSASGTAAYDDRVDLWLGQAPGTPLAPDTDLTEFADADGQGFDSEALLAATEPPDVPSMIIAAEGDTVIPLANVQQIEDWLAAPKRLAVIAGSGHAAFVEPCRPIREEGGLSGFVEDLGLDPADVPLVELGENGCLPADTDPEVVWPLIDHLTVAQLTEVFGDDPAVGTASLERDYLDATFPDLLLDLQETPA
jgi:pimeloyl-ACP methyl ester carboxylesterase